MLGLILGRRAGLACEELILCLLRAVDAFDSDFLGTGPLGDGITLDRGPGVSEPDGWRDKGSITGVLVADLLFEGCSFVTMAVLMRLGRGRVSAAASGKTISSIGSSCSSLETRLACPENCPDGSCKCCGRLVILINVAGVAGALEPASETCGSIAGDLCGNAGGGISGSEIGSGETES